LTQIVREYIQTSGFGEHGPGYFGIDEPTIEYVFGLLLLPDNTAKHGSALRFGNN